VDEFAASFRPAKGMLAARPAGTMVGPRLGVTRVAAPLFDPGLVPVFCVTNMICIGRDSEQNVVGFPFRVGRTEAQESSLDSIKARWAQRAPGAVS
jgi:hypothetical protein